MNSEKKLKWLKGVLIFKILVIIFVWGLPQLFASPALLAPFGVTMPEDPFFIRILGAVQLGLALLYYFAYRDPVRNRDIITYAIVDNALNSLAILGVALTTGLASFSFWGTLALTIFFTFAFWFLRPPKEA